VTSVGAVDFEALPDHEENEDDDGLLHGVHSACQVNRNAPTAVCGKVVPWMSMETNSELPRCPKCFVPVPVCPICGVRLASVEV
jgi:hypothetical protein